MSEFIGTAVGVQTSSSGVSSVHLLLISGATSRMSRHAKTPGATFLTFQCV